MNRGSDNAYKLGGLTLLGALLVSSVAGCGGPAAEGPAPRSVEQQIQDVKNNPKMPPQAKAQVIKMIQQRAAGQGSRPPAQ